MRISLSLTVLGLIAGSLTLVACEDSAGGAGGTGGAGASTNTMIDTGGNTSAGGSTNMGGGGTTTAMAGGGTGGTPTTTAMGPVCPPAAMGAPTVVSGDIASDTTFTADKTWKLDGLVYVKAGATLTIEPGTKIVGDKATAGTLVIQAGAKIIADGAADCPIVFTSELPAGARKPGDWGGVVVLGKAPVNLPGGTGNIEGLPVGPETTYGGTAADDDSGILRYVRIEFAGLQLLSENNSLTFGGVGSKTIVDHVQAHRGFDDCFELVGGTVNAKHLLCSYPEDDGIDWDKGFSGKLQHIAVLSKPESLEDTNGNEGDNDANGSLDMPLSNPTIYNMTLCGMNLAAANDKQQYGMLIRRSSKATIANALVTGFQACIDVRDMNTQVTLTNSICFGNGYALAENNIAFAEMMGGSGATNDDDAGLDERMWFKEAAKMNAETDPKINCYAATPDMTPEADLTGNSKAPPNDGFFDATNYVGAFSANDDWTAGWVTWSND